MTPMLTTKKVRIVPNDAMSLRTPIGRRPPQMAHTIPVNSVPK